jgi:ABC-type dipeptide/oligopeptide/nickel transport system ATPase subunit
MAESLAVKYRPKEFEDVVQQTSTIRILTRQVELEQYAHCYLFAGASGCGKTTIARIFANKKRHLKGGVIGGRENQTARSTLLERRHLVQAYTWHGVPLTTALTRLTLGFQVRLERLWEWETLMPKVTPLPQ